MDEGRFFPVKNGRCVTKVMQKDVLYIMRRSRLIDIETADETYSYYESMKNVAPLLNDDFEPILAGCYVNFSHVVRVGDEIDFDCGKKLMTGRDTCTKARQIFYRYLKTHEERICDDEKLYL